MLRAEGIVKEIGFRAILRGVDLSVARGECLTVFGPNGAGKSTLLRILALLTRPTGGLVYIDDEPAGPEDAALRRRLGVLSHQTYLYGELTGWENLYFFGRLWDAPRLFERMEELLERTGLSLFSRDPVRTYSRGMQQRLALARTLIHSPELLLLDEPQTGLDRQGQEVLRRVLQEEKARGRAILLVTHDFSEGLALADRFLILQRGRVVWEGTRAGLEQEGGDLASLYRRVTEEVRS